MFAQSTGDKESKKKMTQAQFPYWKWTSVNWQLKYTDVVKIALWCAYIRRIQQSILPQVYNCYSVCSLLSLYEYGCGKHKALPSLITLISDMRNCYSQID